MKFFQCITYRGFQKSQLANYDYYFVELANDYY